MTETAPAGFYDDGSGRLRYWNGEAWTDQFQDQAASADPRAAAATAKAEQKAAAAAAKADKKAAAAAARQAKRDRAAEQRAAKQAQKQADLAAFQKRAGRLVKKGVFSGWTVEIYENGYVRVGPLLTAKSPLEELRSISYRRNSRDKGAGGRALGALATGGLNLLSSGEKVQAFLSIATDVDVHQLSATEASRTDEKEGMSLEAAGQAVLDTKRHSELAAQAVAHRTDPPALAEKSVAEQIRDLAALHSEGILSDEEFASAKARLLSEM